MNELAKSLVRLIENTGPISVAHYMADSNSHYYASRDPLGADGDFITAPEISQIFGEMLGIWLADMWLRSSRSVRKNILHPAYIELGPGRGTLAGDVLRTMAQFAINPEVHFIESSPVLRKRQAVVRPDAQWHDSLEGLPQDKPLLIIANEFFDALPVRQLIATHAGWRERVVAHDKGNFIAIPGSLPMDAAVPEAWKNAPTGSILESCPAANGMVFELAGRIARQGGAMLIIDYGYTQTQLGDTLQAVKGHEQTDPFHNPGEQDLTAHVNFADLIQMADAQDIAFKGPVDQRQFLNNLGIKARANMLCRAAPDEADTIRVALDRLTSADQMGVLFKVLALYAPDWPRPEGFG